MSTRTAKEIQGDFLRLVEASPMADIINGGVYRHGMRPRDSKLEDITVSFVSGMASQMQTGIIALCIFVPDIDPYGNGVYVEDGARTEVLERAAQDWIDSNPASGMDYALRLQDTITTVEEPDTKQHFVSVMLHYNLFTDYH